MKILNEIKPTEKERKNVKKIIESVLSKIKIEDAKVELGGSYAKDTFLSGNYDIDVFIKFPYRKYKEKNLSDILGKKLGRSHKRVHGSRDYFQLKKKDYTFEFIPVLDIKDSSQAKNITDVSPLHKRWVKKHLKNPDDVRLIKKFCKAQEVYGAESYIKGFSGYVLEILTVNYESFFNLARSVSSWKLPVYIDVAGHYKNKDEAFKRINKSKRENGVVIIDPAQKERNAAAAISRDNVIKLVNACKDYMHNPSDDFFVEKRISMKDLISKSGDNKLLTAKIKPLSGKKDVIGSKIVKVYSYIENNLKSKDFKVVSSGWHFNDDPMVYYIIKDEMLSEKIMHEGPLLKQKPYAEDFKRKYNNYGVKNERMFVELKREIKNLKDISRILSKDRYIKSNVKKINFKIY